MNPSPPRNRLATAVVLAATLVAIALVLYAWRLPPFTSATESTEDAYVRGSVTIIAPKVDGYVAEVMVQDFSTVEAGQVLVRLDDRNFAQRLAQAQAALAVQAANLINSDQARKAREAALRGARAAVESARAQQLNIVAQLERAEADQRRADALHGAAALSQRERDLTAATLRQAQAGHAQSQAALHQAEAALAVAGEDLHTVIVNKRALTAAVQNAEAAIQLAQIDLDNTRIRAPRAGTVGEVGVKLGQYATPGTQLMALVPSQIWVIANFKEAQTAHMAPGQPVTLQVDALDGQRLHGEVERLAPATGSEFSVIKPDNATGNFTKIPQRIPVRIRVDAKDPFAKRLTPGMSVLARVDTAPRSP